MKYLFTGIFLILAAFQFKFARNYKKDVMKKGSHLQNSYYGKPMIWNNYVTASALLFIALAILLGPLGQ